MEDARTFFGPVEIAQRAQEMKVATLALMLALGMVMDSRLPVLQWNLEMMDLPPNGDFPVDLPVAGEEERLSFSGREVLTRVTTIRGETYKDMMSSSMLLAGIRLGDMIMKSGHLRDDVPLLQFARHFRNACAHGDRWHFEGNQPKHPARLRDLEITRELQGKRATWTVVSPRLFVDFLDDIANHFVPGAVPPPRRA